jgi:hypothetical protein
MLANPLDRRGRERRTERTICCRGRRSATAYGAGAGCAPACEARIGISCRIAPLGVPGTCRAVLEVTVSCDSRRGARGLGCERVAQRCPGGYAGLGKDLAQTGSDGAVRQGKLLAGLLVGQAGGGRHRDLAFLRREPVACWLIGAGLGLAGCLELAGGPAGPRPGAEAFERKPAGAHEILDLCLRGRAPSGLIEFLTGVPEKGHGRPAQS